MQTAEQVITIVALILSAGVACFILIFPLIRIAYRRAMALWTGQS